MIVATRNIMLRTRGNTWDVAIRIFAPENQNNGNWLCRYEIAWPDETKSLQAGGVDSVQALVSALQMIGAELYTTDYHIAGELALEGQSGGYGFPIIPSLRSSLVGDDRRYI